MFLVRTSTRIMSFKLAISIVRCDSRTLTIVVSLFALFSFLDFIPTRFNAVLQKARTRAGMRVVQEEFGYHEIHVLVFKYLHELTCPTSHIFPQSPIHQLQLSTSGSSLPWLFQYSNQSLWSGPFFDFVVQVLVSNSV
jgi:hypothetical protein